MPIDPKRLAYAVERANELRLYRLDASVVDSEEQTYVSIYFRPLAKALLAAARQVGDDELNSICATLSADFDVEAVDAYYEARRIREDLNPILVRLAELTETTRGTNRMTKLFITHAAHDKPLVEAFVDLLESGVGIQHRNIFCSSLKGQGIQPGTDFRTSIGEHFEEATCVLALISEAYYASAFCMCELGGVWVTSKSFLPVLVPPVDHGQLKAVLLGLQVSKIAKEDDLDELRDELASRLGLGLEAHRTPRWNSRRKLFLKALPGLLKKTRFKGPVSREKFEKQKAELEAYKTEIETLEGKVAARDKLVAALKKAKDAKAVAKVVRKHSSTAEAFEALAAAAAAACAPLPREVTEALYYRARGDDYRLKDRGEWEDVRSSVEHGLLDEDEGVVTPNENNPKIETAINALNELSSWLAEPPEDFEDWYSRENEGEEPSLALRPFWKRHLRG